MDTEALIYTGQGCLQPSDSSPCYTVHPVSVVKLMYKDCIHDANKALVSSVCIVVCCVVRLLAGQSNSNRR